jgi:D-alanyl-D-alanine-carboxypeptidase/D-alanyl-D-alanine-endopeptidase
MPTSLLPPASSFRHFCLAVALLLTSAFAWAKLPSNAEVEALINKQLVESKLVKGVAVALIDANGVRVVTAGEAREGVPMKADNLFEIGSVTKTFVGLLLAIAEEKGEANLDDPVEKFLPDDMKLRDSEGQPIRMVDLATHRSGLPRLANNMAPKNTKNPYADYTDADMLVFLKGLTAKRARNAQYEYSNIGYGLLGYALTRAAKAESFDALLTDRIFKPLGMASTTSDPKKLVERLVQPHDSKGQPTPAWDLPSPHAAAGAIRSTAGDMGRYAEAIAGLRESKLDSAIKTATTTREDGPSKMNPIGLAWMRVPFDKRAIMNHDGGTFGSSSSLMVDREAKEAVFIVTNSSTRLFDIALHLIEPRHSIKPREFPKPVNVTPDVLKRYEGKYKLNERMEVVVRVTDNKITAQATGQGEFEIFPESETRFYARVAPIVMTFGEIAEGKAGSFLLEQGGAKITAKRIP